ncbi:MAG: bifunctional GNAT family N-acetyltransferase/acetate--CoA ligase family protein [Thermodesulfobacteriota bacterium]|nr:bifunctional GNAT family N-acetyltransferase/acetate--CoA ligase family protein [Thermodesulfobacteriota bacterium]
MTEEMNSTYPTQYETEVLLKDGSKIMIRPIKRDDAENYLDFVSRLSPRSRYFRFHSLQESKREDAIRFCTVDYTHTFAFVAEVLRNHHQEIVAIGHYYRLPKKQSAEVAFTIEDNYHRKGIGTKLMELLTGVARDHGITAFEADVLSENKEMMTVFRDYGFHITSKLHDGVYHVSFPIARTKKIIRKEEERERISTIASLRYLLYPKSIAVIGASRKPGTIGQIIFQCIIQNRFSGVVYPVNPNADTVMAVKAYHSVLDIPEDIDLAVIVVPAPMVARVTDECGRKGIRAIIVISDGFKEKGPDGAHRERELRAIALGHGMRLVGPNCMGVLNTDPTVNLNATFSNVYPPRGNVAFLSQSGALGLAILDYAKNINIGISTFVSVGNRADISANDMLHYWEKDPTTKVILLYLESFGNPHKFARIARRVSTAKPIIAVKSGSTLAGSRAALSHTGALATPEIASDALFHQAGIIRVNTLGELFDVATLLSNQPLPKGKRVVIVTNGGGAGILAADACEHHGLILPEFSPETIKELRAVIKRDIGFHNPLDMTANVHEEEFEHTLKVCAHATEFDAAIAIFIVPMSHNPNKVEDTTQRIALHFQRSKKPLLVCFLGKQSFTRKLGVSGKSIPCYPFPEDAVSALAKASAYNEWLKKSKGTIPHIRGIKREKARKLINAVLTHSIQRPLWLPAKEIALLLNYYGIRFAEPLVVKTAQDAVTSALNVGFPVAVKLASSTIVHKTDIGGVKLDLHSEEEVKSAFDEIRTRLVQTGRQHEMEGVIVQPMIKGGIEVIAGVTQDPSFGPIIMFGLGGIYAELIKDVAVRLHPLTDSDTRELVGSIKMAKLFEGFRGSLPSDTAALEDLLLRLSSLVEDIPQIAELDLNPVKVMRKGEGYWVVDAKISVK